MQQGGVSAAELLVQKADGWYERQLQKQNFGQRLYGLLCNLKGFFVVIWLRLTTKEAELVQAIIAKLQDDSLNEADLHWLNVRTIEQLSFQCSFNDPKSAKTAIASAYFKTTKLALAKLGLNARQDLAEDIEKAENELFCDETFRNRIRALPHAFDGLNRTLLDVDFDIPQFGSNHNVIQRWKQRNTFFINQDLLNQVAGKKSLSFIERWKLAHGFCFMEYERNLDARKAYNALCCSPFELYELMPPQYYDTAAFRKIVIQRLIDSPFQEAFCSLAYICYWADPSHYLDREVSEALDAQQQRLKARLIENYTSLRDLIRKM